MSAISITKLKDKKFVLGKIVRDCNKLKTGVIRLETTFQYPDGSYVDLFLLEESMLEQPFINSTSINKTKLLLTDLGNTTNSLLDSHVELWATQQAREMVKLVCDSLAVDYENGEFRVFIDEQSGNDLTGYVLRLAQACVRVCYVNAI